MTSPAAEASALQAGVDGEILVPGSEGYDRARSVWNAMIDRRPTLIDRPRTAADVARAAGPTSRHLPAPAVVGASWPRPAGFDSLVHAVSRSEASGLPPRIAPDVA